MAKRKMSGEDKFIAGVSVVILFYILFWVLVVAAAVSVGCWWLVTH